MLFYEQKSTFAPVIDSFDRIYKSTFLTFHVNDWT
jgi:hypothetical protein